MTNDEYQEKLWLKLKGVYDILTGDRLEDYGNPAENFERIAAFWEMYLKTPITKRDVAAMMALLKLARIAGTGGTPDTAKDLIGYAALFSVLSEDIS